MKPVTHLLFLLACAAGAGIALDPVTAEGQDGPGTGAPLSLEQVLDLAFNRNPDLRAAAERIGEAEARLAEAAAAFYPKLVGRVGYTYSNDPAQAFSAIVSQRRFDDSAFRNINKPGFVEDFRPELVGSFSLFRGGQDYYRKKAAELGVEAAELERSALRNGLSAAVTAAYYAALAAPKQVEVARRSLAAVGSELSHARARHQQGVLLRSEVLSLEVRQAQAREAELRALNAVELTRSGLKSLLALDSADPLELREGGEVLSPKPPEELGKLLTQALAQRPEMLAAARQVEMRERELQAEKGGHLPRVNAYAAYGLNERSPEFNFARDNLTLGVNAEVDIFAGGATAARVSGAERRLAAARAVSERTRLEIEDETRKAHATLREALARLEVAEAAARAAEEALRLVHEEYRGGTATVTRYLEAEADRAAAQTAAVTAGFDAQVARANLQKAIGFWN